MKPNKAIRIILDMVYDSNDSSDDTIAALSASVNALDKQVARRPKHYKTRIFGEDRDAYDCPNCHRCFAVNDKDNYCYNCGQHILWDEEKPEKLTCKECKHNVIVSGVQVCWLPFSQKDGDVHTVSAITDGSERCENYEEKSDDE